MTSSRSTPAVLALLVVAAGCGGTKSPDATGGASFQDASVPTGDAGLALCVPGQSIACVGPGGCQSNQVCLATGASYGSCSCAPPSDAGASACVPGQSSACVGPGGCASSQVCAADGAGYGPCRCGSAADGGSGAPSCVPGQSIACAGPGGCVSGQACNAQGTAYEPCDCAAEAGRPVCVPGQSIACAGADGCSSFQVCASDGSGYEPCECPDASVDAGWTPAALPGLALWYDDTSGIVMDPVHAGYVVHWLDKSGSGNVATMGGGPSGPVSQWEGVALDPEVLNGHDAVRCDYYGAQITIADAPTLDWGTGDFAIAMVVRGYAGNVWSGNGVSLSNASDGTWSLSAGGQSAGVGTSATSGFHVVVARGATLSLDVDGTVTTGPASTSALGGGAVTLGAANSGANIEDEIAEVVAVKGTLSDPDLASLVGYLRAKFAL